jgi:8-amino-7-oxononanoate synthase
MNVARARLEQPVHPTARWAADELRQLSELGLLRHLEPLQSPQGAVIRIAGEELINFSSNDYLGLAGDVRLARAVVQGLRERGVGAGASRLLVGDSDAHRSLEQKIARWMNSESALLFNTGYAANSGILPALCGPGDAIFSDALNHASLVDGCRLSRATIAVYPHVDLMALDRLLRSTPGRRRLVCTEAVFSMDGDQAPVAEMIDLCRRHGAALLVDEAHALGMLGASGAGLCEQLGLGSEVDIRVGTLGKALGVFGAFAATSRAVADLLVNRVRPLIFSTALPPAICSAAGCAIDIAADEPELRSRLWRNVQRFCDGLRTLGIPARPDSAIFPVLLGQPDRSLHVAERLRSRGILAKAIRPPTVPAGTSRLRFSLCASHRPEHIDLAVETLAELERLLVR